MDNKGITIQMTHLITLVTILLFACVGAFRPGDEACIMSPENTCSADTLKLSKLDDSTLIYPGGKTRCAFDDYTSRMFKTNATYFFQVFPKKQSKKLLIFFQQGGACIGDLTCNFATQCSLLQRTFDRNAEAMSGGILNASDTDNIFHDWNVVQIPYCTGDLFVGNRVTPAKDIDSPIVRDYCTGKNMSMHMNGYENTMSALNWAVANYPNPEHIVIAGSSAGALGVQLMADIIARIWEVKENKVKYGILADAYLGVVPKDMTTGSLINYYGGCDLLPTPVVGKCVDGTATTLDIMQEMIKTTLFSDWLHLTSKDDWVQRFYLNALQFRLKSLWKNAWSMLSSKKFLTDMQDIVKGEQAASSRVNVFYVEGHQHMFLIDDGWYEVQQADSNETLGSYIKTWLENGTMVGKTSHSYTRFRSKK